MDNFIEIQKHSDIIDDYKRVCHLIGSIFFHGDFRAETVNERELEKLLDKLGYLYKSEDEILEGKLK